jgi:hypothetical protein
VRKQEKKIKEGTNKEHKWKLVLKIAKFHKQASRVYFIFCLVLYFFRRPPKIKFKSRELGPFETTEFAVRRWFETNPILAGCGL